MTFERSSLSGGRKQTPQNTTAVVVNMVCSGNRTVFGTATNTSQSAVKSEPRDHQKLAKSLIAESLREGKRRPVLMAPTGAGKTLIAAIVVENALRQGKRVLFMVPRQDLVGQTLKAFWNEGIRDLGCIHGSALNTIYRMDDGNGPWVMGEENVVREDRSKPVQVASVQTLMRRYKQPDLDKL